MEEDIMMIEGRIDWIRKQIPKLWVEANSRVTGDFLQKHGYLDHEGYYTRLHERNRLVGEIRELKDLYHQLADDDYLPF